MKLVLGTKDNSILIDKVTPDWGGQVIMSEALELTYMKDGKQKSMKPKGETIYLVRIN